MDRYLLINGPNLNLLGTREPQIYGNETLAAIEEEVVSYGDSHDIAIDCFQSNHEGAIIDRLHDARKAYQGIIYNPGAHTHYSYAIRDAIASIEVPTVEVHLSDITQREDFRKISVMSEVCVAQIMGKGKAGYREAVDVLRTKSY